jgi:hypothetical protein
MSGELGGGNSPNIAYAFWRARALDLPKHERWVYIAMAERADGDLHCHAKLPVLACDTGISQRSVWTAIHGDEKRRERGLVERGLIRVESKADGLHYFLLRSAEAAEKPARSSDYRPSWHADEDQNVLNGISQSVQDAAPVDISEPISQSVRDAEPSISQPVQDAAASISQSVRVASRKACEMYNESPLKDSPLEESSGDSHSLSSPPPRVRAPTRALPLARERDPEGWQQFWDAFPACDGDYRNARLAYAQVLAEGVTPEELLAGVRNYQFRPGQYTVHPVNWLRQQRWESAKKLVIDPALVAAGISPDMLAGLRQPSPEPRPTLRALTGGRS